MTPMHTASRQSGGICVAVAAPDTDSAIAAVLPIGREADVVEIRLDAMHEADLKRLCQRIDLPLLFTNRPVWEGGLSRATEEERLLPLLAAVEHGAAYVDLELRAEPSLRKRLLAAITGSAARLIVSFHDFGSTPDDRRLGEILDQQSRSGAHIGKIVTMAHDYSDVLRVLHLQCEARRLGFPLIAFCMGAPGRLSRIITLLLGGYMTYAAPDEHLGTAPGQLSLRDLKDALAVLSGVQNSP